MINSKDIVNVCRANLLKYTREMLAYTGLPPFPVIADIGCGTGVVTLALAELFEGKIFAADIDPASLCYLQDRIKEKARKSVIVPVCKSFDVLDLPEDCFDLIIAEGLLNVVGFEKGLSVLSVHLKPGGFFIIHDDAYNRDDKQSIIWKYGFETIATMDLDSGVWWNEYYACLERKISSLGGTYTELFAEELAQIRAFKKDPSPFNSVYYVLKKQVSAANLF